MKYGTIHVSPEKKKLVKQYATDKETTIKAVIEKLISELMADTQEQPVIK